MRRLVRIAGSFAVVLAAYCAYALVAVPLIEPEAEARNADSGDSPGGYELNRGQVAVLAPLFPAGSWELQAPKILESEQFRLLIRDYRNFGDGTVELRPCTMIIMPAATDGDPADRIREAVVLQAPEGAQLKFDRPFDLSRADIGRLVGGKLIGPISIRSQGKLPGPEDDLSILTRDVQMQDQEVQTPETVDFRWGPNYGRGHGMRIKLRAGAAGRDGRSGPAFGGIEVFELAHIERLHVELGDSRPATPADGPARTAVGSPAALAATAKSRPGDVLRPTRAAGPIPLEIACRGPFRCDMAQQVATFEEQVSVWRVNPTGPADQLNCEILSLYFMSRPAAQPAPAAAAAGLDKSAAAASKPARSGLNLVAQRLEARGDPVVLNAPSEKLAARGQRLEYDLQRGRIAIDGSEEVWLTQGGNEVRGRGLQYTSAGPGKLGEVAASGPGWLRGQLGNRRDQVLEVRWGEQLHLRPHEQNHLLSLTGGSELNYRGLGLLKAREIHCWLDERPAAKPGGAPRVRPDRLLARDDARIESPQLCAAVAQMEVWFEPGDAPRESKWRPGGAEPQAGPGDAPQARPQPSPTAAGERAMPPLALAAGGWTAEGKLPAGSSPAAPPPRRFEINGRLLRARVLVAEAGPSELTEAIVEENARLSETLSAESTEQPLLVAGDQLHVVDAMRPHGAVTVVGRPARLEGRGIRLTGANISLNRGTNRLWIDGAGGMDLPLSRDLDGRPLKNPGALHVDWQRRMSFDGRSAKFEESVVAAALLPPSAPVANAASPVPAAAWDPPQPAQSIRTETLEVQFRDAVRFDAADLRRAGQKNPEVETLLCRGGVLMDSRTYDAQGQVSHERMQLADLAVNMLNGALSAGGPGWLCSVRRGGADDPRGGAFPGATVAAAHRPIGANALAAPGAASPATSAGGADSLRGLTVRFQGSIGGNVLNRTLVFRDQVAAAFAPVNDWTETLPTDQPERLGPNGVVMHCDQLGVSEVAALGGNRRAIEIEASGNTIVEGDMYTAKGLRMTYAEAKDMLVLEGDGRTDAELFRQPQAGGERSRVAARKILYWPRSNKLWIDGARSLDINGFSPGRK